MFGTRIAGTVTKYRVTDFPLKHEVQERGRSEMLHENVPQPNTIVGRPARTSTNDISDTWIYGMGASIHNRVHIKLRFKVWMHPSSSKDP